MKYIAYYCLFYSAKQIAYVWHGQTGYFNIWLSMFYATSLVFVFLFPFKRELKLVFATLLILDATAPLIPNNAFRVLGLVVSTLWLSTFLWRRFVRKDAMSPWAEG